MPDCDHCGASFDDEDALLAHLGEEHYDELGAIDRRRVDERTGDDDGFDLAPLVLGGVILVAAGLVAYVIFFAGGGGGSGDYSVNGITVAQTPTGEAFQGTHLHGGIEMTVMGDRVDFSQQQYQLQAEAFHFESNNGDRWHMHAPGVTLQYAMATLGINVTDDTVTFQGTTYTDGENATVTVTVNGNDVTPADYVLKDGDDIRVVVSQ